MNLQDADYIDETSNLATDLLLSEHQDSVVTDLCNRILHLVLINKELRFDLNEKYRIIRVLRGES